MKLPRRAQCELCLVFHEDLVQVCEPCAGDLHELSHYYSHIMARHPKLRGLSQGKLLEFLYERAKACSTS